MDRRDGAGSGPESKIRCNRIGPRGVDLPPAGTDRVGLPKQPRFASAVSTGLGLRGYAYLNSAKAGELGKGNVARL